LILITVGILFLLSNLGVLKVDFWQLWRLWPVLLILLGIDLIIGRRSTLGSVIALVLAVVVIGGAIALVALTPDVFGREAAERDMRIEEPLGSVDEAELRVGFAAGTLEIERLQDSDALIKGDLELASNRRPVWEFSQSGENAQLALNWAGSYQPWSGRGDRWDLALSPRVAFSLDVDVGAGDATIDLTGLDIRDLRIQTGAGRNTIVLPEEGRFEARVTGGVGQMIVEIPREMGARIEVDRGLGGLQMPRRFERLDGDVYESENWDSSDNRVTIEIEVGIGQLTIRDR
jgi:hypothetical protein